MTWTDAHTIVATHDGGSLPMWRMPDRSVVIRADSGLIAALPDGPKADRVIAQRARSRACERAGEAFARRWLYDDRRWQSARRRGLPRWRSLFVLVCVTGGGLFGGVVGWIV